LTPWDTWRASLAAEKSYALILAAAYERAGYVATSSLHRDKRRADGRLEVACHSQLRDIAMGPHGESVVNETFQVLREAYDDDPWQTSSEVIAAIGLFLRRHRKHNHDALLKTLGRNPVTLINIWSKLTRQRGSGGYRQVAIEFLEGDYKRNVRKVNKEAAVNV
jgi:hypothetical protein